MTGLLSLVPRLRHNVFIKLRNTVVILLAKYYLSIYTEGMYAVGKFVPVLN
jgi:hypothetical protein